MDRTRYILSDYLTFLRELPRAFPEIGAMLPSSQHLGKLMVSPVRASSEPLNILEVGPGTGPFTRQIIEAMSPQDNFTICEINPRFMKRLRASLERIPAYQCNKERIHFHTGDVHELADTGRMPRFDVIVSSLPFLNFTPEVVDSIFRLFESMLSEDGTITFFHYSGLPKLRTVLTGRETRARVRGVEQVLDHWSRRAAERGQVKKKRTYLNVPPAMAVEFQYSRAA